MSFHAVVGEETTCRLFRERAQKRDQAKSTAFEIYFRTFYNTNFNLDCLGASSSQFMFIGQSFPLKEILPKR